MFLLAFRLWAIVIALAVSASSIVSARSLGTQQTSSDQVPAAPQSDAPSPFLAEFKTTLGGRQVPIPFTLKFDPAKIAPKHPYVVEASILVHDQLRFTNDTAYLVLAQGHPQKSICF